MKHVSIKKMFFLTIMSVLACSQVNAQLVDVAPGSKGNLPAPPELPKAAEGHFGALCVRNVCLESEYIAISLLQNYSIPMLPLSVAIVTPFNIRRPDLTNGTLSLTIIYTILILFL